jgi:hypothetical protein
MQRKSKKIEERKMAKKKFTSK